MWLTGAVAILYAFAVVHQVHGEWRCPDLSVRPSAECSCDLPHTLRCAGDHTALQKIGRHLREQKARYKGSSVSLLDLSLRGVSALSTASVSELAGVGLHGLVISSGEIRRVQQGAFTNVASTLFAIGLPNNQLPSIPTEALSKLTYLDRLDLSNNKIHLLEDDCFKGLRNLTYLDISDNQLTDISPEAFKPLIKLSVLRLRGNLLKVSALASLKEAQMLKDLDLSSNALQGPLGPNTVPALRHLNTLQLSDNTFASIRRGALAGLPNLTHLSLHNNQIDVLEDYAFRHLTNLTHLDLSHNEIVAVSSASLAQLDNLSHLDLSHNFLRSLSAEPLKALKGLNELFLHDNDISMIDDGALAQHVALHRLTVEDNPLNCDCLMAGFSRWLREATSLSIQDRAAAVCATPPHLEGALLSRLSKNKLCDDFEHTEQKNKDKVRNTEQKSKNNDVSSQKNDINSIEFNKVAPDDVVQEDFQKVMPTEAIEDDIYSDDDGLKDDVYDQEIGVPSEDDLPISKYKVRLQDASFEGSEVYLRWSLDPPSTRRYRCTGVTASKGGGLPKHVACHRAAPGNVLLRGMKTDPNEEYTFCIALEEMDSTDNPVALVLGCGQPQLVRERTPIVTVAPVVVTPQIEREQLRVTEVRSNVTSDGTLTVIVSLNYPQMSYLPSRTRLTESFYPIYPLSNCYVVVAVLNRDRSLIAQKDTPCAKTLDISMEGFLRGPYDVCATISKFKDEIQPICVVPQFLEVENSLEMKSGFKNLNTALVGMVLGLMAIVIGLVWFVRKMLKKPVHFEPHPCMRAEPVPQESPRNSYAMLTATSKL